MKKNLTKNYDLINKEMLRHFMLPFLVCFNPNFAAKIKLDTEIKFLDKEVITSLAPGKKIIADIVAIVTLTGGENCIIVHIEQQSIRDPLFYMRMLAYLIGLYLKYKIPVYPIALLTYATPDKTGEEETGIFEMETAGEIVLKFQYKVVAVHNLHWQEYANRNNPTAAALMGAMNVKEDERVIAKLAAIEQLVECKLTPEESRIIGLCLDTYLELDSYEQAELEDAISKLESDRKEETMEMLTSWEKKGRIEGRLEGKQEGRLEGRLEGKQEGIQLLVKSMSSYFKMEIPDLIAREISDLPDMNLSKLAGEWPSMHSVTELEAWITMNRAEAKSGTN